jgi:predicted nucleic acid-binding protein
MQQAPVLIDSNVFIAHLRAHRDPVWEIGKAMDLENVVSCGVVKAEVLRGVISLKVRKRLEEFFAVTQNVNTGMALWEDVWQMAWKLDRDGRVIPLQDIIIACCALRAGASVMTFDNHFQTVPGLHVIPPL